MGILAQRLLTLLGLALVAGAVAPTGADQPIALLAALSVVSIAAVAISVVVVLAASPHTVTVGARAREHRDVVSGMPEPQHPATPGRTRSRAPGGRYLAA